MIIKNHYKASSLSNAIFLCLIISILCGSLVLISHYQNALNVKLEMSNHLISRNNSAFNYYVNNIETLSINKESTIDIFEDGIYSYAEKKNWGFYDILMIKTIFKNDTICKIALVGTKEKNNTALALYVTDYDKPLKLSGKSRIYGNIKVPIGKTEQTYINNKINNDVVIKGNEEKSGDKLPKLSKNITVPIDDYDKISLETIESEIIINSFENETKVLDLNGITSLNNLTCKGNLILKTNNPVTINATTTLEDIVLMAPKVVIDSGFRGNIQIIANEKVVIKEKAKLLYPSSIYIKNDIDSATVDIKKGAKLAGGIVIDGNTYIGSLKRKLTIEEKATIIGDIYCYGRTQVKGEIIGSIYSDRFYLKTKSSQYENVILNATINRDSLPRNFVGLPLFETKSIKKEYVVIKTF
ncbi:polymer-forming cytoskeletal protein [Pontimicrobium sp. MEBiC06410]